MKSILISIQPKWCELIANGKKTIEVRKTKPKLDTPFKVYIYCTKSKEFFTHGGIRETLDDLYRLPSVEIKYGYSGELMCYSEDGYDENNFLNGKVIGEFVCKAILPISITYSDPNSSVALREFPFTCLTDKEIMYYLGNGKVGYGWCISDLAIYDKPKELSEFRTLCKYRNDDGSCQYTKVECDCVKFDFNPDCSVNLAECCDYITRPPQSWCYVEGSYNNGE